jgi:hypothetical protein
MVRCISEHEYLWCLKLHCEDFLGIISQIYTLEERNITLGNKEMQQHMAQNELKPTKCINEQYI